MSKKTVVSILSGVSALILAATCLPALAFGGYGHHRGGHGGDMKYGLYAHAGGLTGQQIHAAFKNDTALKTDFQNFRSAKKALDACLVAGTCSNGEVAAYASAQQALTQEKLTVWQGLFASAPNKTAAVNLKSTLDSINAQKRAAFKTAFGGSFKGAPTAESTQQ